MSSFRGEKKDSVFSWTFGFIRVTGDKLYEPSLQPDPNGKILFFFYYFFL